MEQVIANNLNHICQNEAECVDSAAYDSFITYCFEQVLMQGKQAHFDNNFDKLNTILLDVNWKCPNKLRTAIYLYAFFASSANPALIQKQVIQNIANNAIGSFCYTNITLPTDQQMVQISCIQALCWLLQSTNTNPFMYVAIVLTWKQ